MSDDERRADWLFEQGLGSVLEVEVDTEARAGRRVALGAVIGVDPPVDGGIQLGFGPGVSSHIRSDIQLDAYDKGQLGY